MVDKQRRFLNKDAFISKHETFAIEVDFLAGEDNNFSVVKVLALVSKYYGSYGLKLSEPSSVTGKEISEFLRWENLLLYEMRNIYESERFLAYLELPFFVEFEKDIKNVTLREHVTYSKDRKGFSLTFYPKVFTDEIYVWEKEDKIYISQAKAAKINRQLLREFLKELEKVVEGKITNYWSVNIDSKYLYEYGIKEEAVLK